MPSSDKQLADAIQKAKIKQIAKPIPKKYLCLKLSKSEDEISFSNQ